LHHHGRRDEIINTIKKAYAQAMNKNIKLFGVESADLSPYTTTDKDIKKGFNRHPLMSQKITKEDVLTESSPKELEKLPSKEYQYETIASIRCKCYGVNHECSHSEESDEDIHVEEKNEENK